MNNSNNNDDTLNEILGMNETDTSGSESSTEKNVKDTSINEDTLDPENEEVEGQTEEEFWDGRTPLNKVKRFQEVNSKKKEFETLAEQRGKELDDLKKELETLKGASTTQQQSTTDAKATIDPKQYSDDILEVLTQLPETKFEKLFEYELDEDGKPIGYKDPSKKPETMEDIANFLYPLFEKKIWERNLLIREIGQKKEAARKSEEEALQAKQKDETLKTYEEIKSSLDGDEEAIAQYMNELENDVKEFHEKYGKDEIFNVKQHLKLFLKNYSKKSAIDNKNVQAASKVSSKSQKAEETSGNLYKSDFTDFVLNG